MLDTRHRLHFISFFICKINEKKKSVCSFCNYIDTRLQQEEMLGISFSHTKNKFENIYPSSGLCYNLLTFLTTTTKFNFTQYSIHLN